MQPGSGKGRQKQETVFRTIAYKGCGVSGRIEKLANIAMKSTEYRGCLRNRLQGQNTTKKKCVTHPSFQTEEEAPRADKGRRQNGNNKTEKIGKQRQRRTG